MLFGITIVADMPDSHDSSPIFRPYHVEFDVTPLSCATNAGVSRHIEDIRKTLERVTKYAMLEVDTPPDHPAVVALINASSMLRQAKAVLDGPPIVSAPAGGPQIVPMGGRRPH
jgi:hypothetical protein